MPAYLKIGEIKGEATEQGHKEWVIIQSMSDNIARSIPQGSRDQQRARGETTLADISLVRQLDKSSVTLKTACANGTFFPEVEIHFCTQVKNKQEPYLIYKLKNVIVTSYSFSGNASGDPVPVENVTLGFSEVEWTYVVVDPNSGDRRGQVLGKFSTGAGHS
ncbi:MAG: type VI secretion system tube protein Hcp [Planctomycetes bacterium]|nr:type VI secretion system tube protein Hcp [Planctomycetota bacterium]